MSHLYDTQTTLQTETRVRLEANYNRTVQAMTKPGDILFYKAPEDPAEHPMYVDSEGRIMPVSPTTLQPMTNANGNIVDKNGVLLPRGEVDNHLAHIDDVRIAVTSSDFEVTDENGDEIFISHDGVIIPTNDDGVPNTVLVDGVPWVIGPDGQPHAPLERVFPLRSYKRPVRAENVPVDRAGAVQPKVEDPYPEYFSLDSIAKPDRPKRMGVQVAWATSEDNGARITSGFHAYDGPRFYTASAERPYKYWVSPTVSSNTPSLLGPTVDTFGDNWRTTGGTNRATGTNMVSADFNLHYVHDRSQYFERVLHLDSEKSYAMSFKVAVQATTHFEVELLELSDVRPGVVPGHNPGPTYKTRKLGEFSVSGGTQQTVNYVVSPGLYTATHIIRIRPRRGRSTSFPKITLTDLSLREASYPLEGTAPRTMYDRPVTANKIVIGVDYAVDQRVPGQESHSNKPNDTIVRVCVDRGDGLFVWRNIATNPEIDEDGKITLFHNGGDNWTEDRGSGEGEAIMGVQYVVLGLKKSGARINITEISARRTYDISELLREYSIDSNVADESFVLPFGTVNSNSGALEMSNHDGRFNSNNEFLLNQTRSIEAGHPVFTSIKNPFYQMLNTPVEIEIDTATFVPGDTDIEHMRVFTGRAQIESNPGTDSSASFEITDDAAFLEGITPPQVFYTGDSMSTMQVLYMLLDSIGFTGVRFADEDEHFSTHLKYFWVGRESNNVWAIIAEVCEATQTVAFFDEYNYLHFKSLKGIYEDALSKPVSQVFATEDLPGILSNVKNSDLMSQVAVNKVTLNYREITEPEKTPSGLTPMEVVWEPEGTEVVRSGYLREGLNDKQPTAGGGSRWLVLPPDSTRTWQWEGMVQVEGELIEYKGKEYKYHISSGATKTKVIYNEEERKELDKENEYLSFKNNFTGRLRITKRGCEGTMVKPHQLDTLQSFDRKYVSGSRTITNYTNGLSIKQSRLFVVHRPKMRASSTITATRGNVSDTRPHHLGTRLRLNRGGHAGVCFGVSGANDDGVFVEISSTEATEANGRPRGELHVFVRKNKQIKHFGFGVDVPISLFRDYSLDVGINSGDWIQFGSGTGPDLSLYYPLTLKQGDRGAAVTALQTALNLHANNLTVNGRFDQRTRDAVIRFQRQRGMPANGTVTEPVWKGLEQGHFKANHLVVHATIDGVFTHSVQIPNSELPANHTSGKFGLYTRGCTDASFEYLYALNGQETIDIRHTGFFDYVTGGFVSDQLDAGWLYNTKQVSVPGAGGTSNIRNIIHKQLYMNDFGPYAHEVRDYNVEFTNENPSLSSYVYHSNERDVLLVDYRHRPFGASFRAINKSRKDAILRGEDLTVYGSENAVEQVFMIYGTAIKTDDERSLTIADETSISARGSHDLTIDADWVQSKESAQKLGSHIVEAMSSPVSSFELDVFGHAGIRVGQIVAIYDPKQGLGDKDNPRDANRFFVHSVEQSNNGAQSTSVGVREVISMGGRRALRLKDVLEANNNALNMNPDISDYTTTESGLVVASGYGYRSGLAPRYHPITNSMRITATGDTPYRQTMYAHPYPDGVGRFDHGYGDYFLLAATFTASSPVGVELVIEGWPTNGSMQKILASKAIRLDGGRTATFAVKGQFLSDGNLPELYPGIRLVDYNDASSGAPIGRGGRVSMFYFRTSQNEDDLYPLHGGAELRKL